MAHPEIDTQIFPRHCVSVIAGMCKLLDYGGILVRGQTTLPTRGIRILLDDWKTLGPPKKLTVRGYGSKVVIDKTSVMICAAGDATCLKYFSSLVSQMREGSWHEPRFQDGEVELI